MTSRPPNPSRALVGRRLAAFPRRARPADGLTSAAVAVTVVEHAGVEPAVLVTVRTDHLRAHSGQFALPGGRVEAGESVADAALRELAEELGVDRRPDDVVGVLDDLPTRSGYLITPVVVWAGHVPVMAPDPDEVAEVHEVAFRDLDRPAVPRFHPSGDPDRPLIEFPLLGTSIYAPTAAILYQFREVALRGQPTRVHHLEQPRFAWE